jgi:hypothetical protein
VGAKKRPAQSKSLWHLLRMPAKLDRNFPYENRNSDIDGLGNPPPDVSQMSRRQDLPQVDLHRISQYAGMLPKLWSEV